MSDKLGFSAEEIDTPCVQLMLTPRHAAIMTQVLQLAAGHVEAAEGPGVLDALGHIHDIGAQIAAAAIASVTAWFADAADEDFARLLGGGAA